MGNWNSGRRPQATQMKVLRGTGKARSNEPQPQRAGAEFDVPPEEIRDDDLARAEWMRIVPVLRACGLISAIEKPALIALCQQWSIYLQAQQDVATCGVVVEKPSGIPMMNPSLRIATQALQQCRALWQELGVTASGRARMSALPNTDPVKPESKWAGILP